MIPYYFLILVPAVLSFVSVQRKEGGKRVLRIGTNERIKKENLAIPGFFAVLLLLLALRHESVGRDLGNYRYIFSSYRKDSLAEVARFGPEMLFALLNWGIGQLTDQFQVLLAVAAAMTLLPIFAIYREDRNFSYLKLILFVNMSTFVMLFSGIRQSLAIAMGMLAYRYVRQRKPVKFLLMALVGIGFHHSAFMLLAMYPMYHARFRKKHLLIIVPAIVVTFVFNRQLFGFLTGLVARFIKVYDTTASSTGAVGSLVLFALFAVFSFVIPDEASLDAQSVGLRNFLLLSVVLQCFAPVHSLAMRLNYYYILFIPVLLPKVIETPRQSYRQVAKLANVVLCAFFTWEFVSGIYTAYVTGVSALDTVPYVPFWLG